MPYQLLTPFQLSNGQRIVIDRPHVEIDEQVMSFNVQLRTGLAGSPADAIIAQVRMVIRSSGGDQVRRGSVPTAGFLASALDLVPGGVVVANAFANALAALNANRATFETHLLTVGFIHGSLGA